MAELNEVQFDPHTFERILTTSNVPDCLASILDKKVEDVALNCLEALVDWICTHLYSAYNTLYGLKCALLERGWDPLESGQYSVSHAPNSGIPVYDFTDRQNAEYDDAVHHAIIRLLPILRINNQQVFLKFSRPPAPEPVFSRENGVDHLVVSSINETHYQVSAYYNGQNNPRRWYFDAGRYQREEVSIQERRNGLLSEEAQGRNPQRQEDVSLQAVLEQRGLSNLPRTKAASSSQGIEIYYVGEKYPKIKLEQILKGIDGESGKRHLLYIGNEPVSEHFADGRPTQYLEFRPQYGDDNHFVLLTDFVNPRKPNEKRLLLIEPGKKDREVVFPLVSAPYCRPPKLVDPEKPKAKK